MKKRLKILISIIFFFILMIIISFLSFNKLFQILPLIFFISFLVSFYSFGERETMSMFGILILVSIIFGIIFMWIFGLSFPGATFKLTDQNIISIFTIVLAIATIINIVIYNRSIKMSRLSVLDFYLLQDSLNVKIENLGNFPARAIKVDVKIFEKLKKDSSQKERFKIKFWQRLKDFIDVKEQSLNYLSPKNSQYLDFSDFLSKRLKIYMQEDYYGNSAPISQDKKTEKEYLLIFRMIYHTDHLFKSPLPIIRKYNISITKKEVKIDEIKH